MSANTLTADQILAGLLQALEQSIDLSDRFADVVRQCLDSQRSGVPLDDAVVADYESQLVILADRACATTTSPDSMK
jgi:hypothetical protein